MDDHDVRDDLKKSDAKTLDKQKNCSMRTRHNPLQRRVSRQLSLTSIPIGHHPLMILEIRPFRMQKSIDRSFVSCTRSG
jgi:hypothetical protein